MRIEYDKMINRFNAAKSRKTLWNSHLRECYEYAMPQRNTIDGWTTPGQKKRNKVFDSTAEDALEDYATRMESELVPPNINWMKLESGTDVPEDKKDVVEEYLDETTEVVFNHIRSSNFSSQVHEAFLDLGISTGAIIVEPGDGIQSSLNFRCVPLTELYLEHSSKAIVDTVFRKITIPANSILDTWESAKLTESLKKMVEEKPEQEVSFIEGIMPVKDMYFSFVAYEKEKTYILEETLESNHWIIFRESTIPGETYGRGRVMRAINDIKTLNKMVEDHLKSAAFVANPVFTASDDGVINPYTIRLTPGAIIPVGSNSTDNPTLRPLPPAGDYNILQYDIRALQDGIRRIMISKPFGNIEESPVRTATEMSIRNADMAKVSLGASGRIQNELLEALVARCVYILKQAGKIADFKVDGKEVAIKFTSPSSRLQDENQLAAMGRFIEMMQAIPPEVVNEVIRVERFPTEMLDVLGLPSSLKRSKEELAVRQQQQAMAEQQRQEQVMMMAQQEQANAR